MRRLKARLVDHSGRVLVALGLGVLTLVGAVGLQTPAWAASRITGCFYYNGAWWKGLSTAIEYQTVSGGWNRLQGSNWHTGSQGCATYHISGRYRQWHLREVAFGELKVGPNSLGMFLGVSRYYSPSGAGRANLGSGQLTLYTFPMPSDDDWAAGNWLNEMSGSGAPNCSSSGAMQVACWEDRNGIHGDIVVVPHDTDNDGIYDDVDRNATNPYIR